MSDDSRSEIKPLNVDYLQGVKEDTSILSVIGHIPTAPKQREDWKYTSIFSDYSTLWNKIDRIVGCI